MLHNLSNWQAITVENWQQDKQKCLTIVVKQSFEYDDNGNVFPMETSEDIILADEMLADPSASSLTTANETVAFKQGFELYGNLTAYPPKAKHAKVIEVNVSLTQENSAVLNKTLRVTGKRVWRSSLLGSKASDPKALVATALTYENTYGGVDIENEEKTYEENPAGIGFRVKKAKNSPLPSVEYPMHWLKHPKKHIPPASYGAIPLFWQPRLSLLPDVDKNSVITGEYPYQSALPANVFNYAPQDQQLKITFNNAMSLHLKGVSPNKDYHHSIELALPYSPPQVALFHGEQQTNIDLTCDTLVMNTDANSFHLVWRKSINKSRLNAYSKILVQPNTMYNQVAATTKSDNT